MPKPKSKKPKIIAGVSVASRPHKKGAPSNAFKKGNTSGFQPGVSGNPGGKVKCDRDRLIGKSIIRYLQDPASDEVCKSHDLPPKSSWGQILAKRLLRLALRGEQWAYSEILALTEVKRARLDLVNFDGDAEDARPLIELVFVPGVEGRPDPEFLAAHPEFTTETKALPPTLSGAA
jgi:hypothetical protein